MSRLYVEPRKRRRRRQSPSDSSVMLHVLRDGGAAGIEELAGSETRSQMSGSAPRKYLRGSRTVLRDFTSNVRTVRPDILFPELQLNKIRLVVLFGPP